ncbi:MAG TPA: nitrilase-related carbon-nitrogen hydrolase, partial [Opitutaceae bacterium]|nr:nitrilase-related carbon-nitrogen hydrolase [Opitutaceae bacterium]
MKPSPRLSSLLVSVFVFSAAAFAAVTTPTTAPDGWQTMAPRAEIQPRFAFEPAGGADGKGSFIVEADANPGRHGYWTKTFSLQGGRYFRFRALRKVDGLDNPRRNAVVRILWQNDAGRSVPTDEDTVRDVLPTMTRTAEAEHPTDGNVDARGWTEVTGIYRAPPKATRAVVELHLQWVSDARVEWSAVSFAETSAPAPRKVRLASVHYRPVGGKSPMENCREFAPLIADAAQQRADFVVLPETLTYYKMGRSYADCAEPVPGPSTDYFGTLAQKHNLYIVAG